MVRKRQREYVKNKTPMPEKISHKIHKETLKFPTYELTIEIVHPEEELDLVVGGLSGELVHGVQELREGDGAAVVPVEDLEHPLGEERLRGEEKRACEVRWNEERMMEVGRGQ